jgi:predicted dehydrogenase
MFIDPLAGPYKDWGELVGLCDVNPVRLEFHRRRLVDELHYQDVPAFAAEDFEQMVRRTRPDCVIVTTVDCFHHRYIIGAMELGCDAITEKPMTIDDEKCRAILDTIRRTGRKLKVTFNYRWGPGPTLIRRLLADGAVGQVIHVDLAYLLNTSHGADYFRRWHREKDKSGGLMVHKATHHFDLVNWWLDAVPDTVYGLGRLAFYGRENARRRGIEVKYDRYTGHDTAGDPFALDLTTDPNLRGLYLAAESHDGYRRDRNVFGEPISIEDTMSALVCYRTGVVLNYSLNAFLPREGFHVAFNGTKGRLEYQESHGSHIITGQSSARLGEEMTWQTQCVLHPMFGAARKVPIPAAEGGHGGGDPQLQEQIFAPHAPPDPLGRNAGHGQGAASILVGIAANRSFRTGMPVRIKDLCPQLGDATRLAASMIRTTSVASGMIIPSPIKPRSIMPTAAASAPHLSHSDR